MKKYILIFQENSIPKYVQLYKYIKNMIDKNKIKDNEKLPSIRKLSNLLGINTVTVINAYKKLESDGYAIQKIGSGTYAKKKEISRNLRKEYSDSIKSIDKKEFKSYIDFIGESACSDLFPVESFKSILNEVLDRDGKDALVYQETLGFEGLRQHISEVFWNNKIEKNHILIVSGAQQGIDIISKSIINVNDNVLIEKPTYSGALSVFKWRRANIYEVPMDEDGVNIKELEKIVKKNNIKCFYTMSYFQNPTGISCSLEKKKAILNLATIYDFYIIEDDYLSELIYDKNMQYITFKSLDRNDRVIYIKSFSKIFLPGIRIGYVIAPKDLREAIQNSKINTDISTSSLMQRALDLYLIKGLWKEYINYLYKIYVPKYEFTKNIIQDILESRVEVQNPGGGLHFYIKIKDNININSMELFNECMKNKVLITPGVLFYKNPKEGLKHFRLGFSENSIEQIELGVKKINNILEKRVY
ncbi:PLP-dependent aminotransferase family protein [Clostridium sporogenes]|uniref:PLP-dependent aminotransferase family protein n=1 Tax=Clostridium sporogenes TaxID=1509 RepID=A0AAE4FM17_CLOSG|nr:PLP-dependent aminotransferase family protein [Clostridium sporogenes]MDS1003650.1 PLP-dependent aminotransferase family protein [Clostridium sporogenes]